MARGRVGGAVLGHRRRTWPHGAHTFLRHNVVRDALAIVYNARAATGPGAGHRRGCMCAGQYAGTADMKLTRRQVIGGLAGAAAALATGLWLRRVMADGEIQSDRYSLVLPADERAAVVGPLETSIVEAVRPFSFLVIQVFGTLPPGTPLHVEVRTAVTEPWSAWQSVESGGDQQTPSADAPIFDALYTTPSAAERRWQLRLTPGTAPDGALPSFTRIDVTALDTVTRVPIQPSLPDRKSARPTIVGRTQWGCPDGDASPNAPAEYHPVTHLVVHHTATSNVLAPGRVWADTVRAIWQYHAVSRGWGDIGYNYLIDPDGVIYEGRAGGDDVIGFHDAANRGSMGVSLLGSFGFTPPQGAALNALTRLLIWKSAQRGINPVGSALYPGCRDACTTGSGVVATILGHRDVFGSTVCPGNAFHGLLPSIRSQVQTDVYTGLSITNVEYSAVQIAAGQLLRIRFTVANTGTVTMRGQSPRATVIQGQPDPADEGYVYDQDESFGGNVAGTIPNFPKEAGAVRVILGSPGWDAEHAGSLLTTTGDAPWRWGLYGDLAPGESQTVTGFVRFNRSGSYTLRAGIIEEYVMYHNQNVFEHTLVVVGDTLAPEPMVMNAALVPLATVRRTATIPRNALSRSDIWPACVRGRGLTPVAWDGAAISWSNPGLQGETGPLFIDQTRAIHLARSGTYTFQLISSGRGGLHVDGQLVVATGDGTTAVATGTGEIGLSAGTHVLTYQGYLPPGAGTIGYGLRVGSSGPFAVPVDGFGGGTSRFLAVFTDAVAPVLVGDDRGGSGVAAIRWRIASREWVTTAGGVAQLPRLENGSYRIAYLVQDVAGNWSAEQRLELTISPNFQTYRMYLPIIE